MERGRRRAFMPVRAPLIVKNSQEKVDDKKAHAARAESSESPSPLLTRSFRLNIRVFSLLSHGSHCIPRFPSKKSFVYRVVIEPGFFLQSTQHWGALRYQDQRKFHHSFARITENKPNKIISKYFAYFRKEEIFNKFLCDETKFRKSNCSFKLEDSHNYHIISHINKLQTSTY